MEVFGGYRNKEGDEEIIKKHKCKATQKTLAAQRTANESAANLKVATWMW
jgi:hypothetical protein